MLKVLYITRYRKPNYLITKTGCNEGHFDAWRRRFRVTKVSSMHFWAPKLTFTCARLSIFSPTGTRPPYIRPCVVRTPVGLAGLPFLAGEADPQRCRGMVDAGLRAPFGELINLSGDPCAEQRQKISCIET